MRQKEALKAGLIQRVTVTLDFHVNTPIRWNAGRDMNIAPPGASVMIDPVVKAGVPIIMGMDVTTRSAAERITAYPN